MKQHTIKRNFGGKAESGWIQPYCTCGWTGQKHYAYEDYQHTNCQQESQKHIRESKPISS